MFNNNNIKYKRVPTRIMHMQHFEICILKFISRETNMPNEL